MFSYFTIIMIFGKDAFITGEVGRGGVRDCVCVCQRERELFPEPLLSQVATFEDALKDAAAEIDELREKVSVNEREKRVATLDASASKTLLSGLHAEAQVSSSMCS